MITKPDKFTTTDRAIDCAVNLHQADADGDTVTISFGAACYRQYASVHLNRADAGRLRDALNVMLEPPYGFNKELGK